MSTSEANGAGALTRNCFVARQPILDARRRVFGYELLFRSGYGNHFAHADGNDASLRVIDNTLSVFGLDSLTAGKRAFINFTRDVLLGDHVYLLPPRHTIVELLETVEPDERVLDACRRLKRAGYVLALDDYVGDPASDPLLVLADIIKVDFRALAPEQRRLLALRLAPRGVRLLAEKVETWEEYREAADLGYTYFQGYFFCRPETLARQALAPSRANHLRLLEELNRPEVDLVRVEQVIKQEASLALKLLSYINSVLFGSGGRVRSIRHAATLLGPKNLRRWAALTATMGLCDGKPPELLVTCLVRARFCELLGCEAGFDPGAADPFLTGLLSLIDAILDRPIAEALAQFGAPPTIREAILDGVGPTGRACTLARAYEGGDWGRIAEAAAHLDVGLADIADAYRRAVEWSAEATASLASR